VTEAARRPGRPRQLHREDIPVAAVGVIDAEGLEALTMRRMGAALGVTAMSLYRHTPAPYYDAWGEAGLAALLRGFAG
jgi:AcrR family transcriptional regulator